MSLEMRQMSQKMRQRSTHASPVVDQKTPAAETAQKWPWPQGAEVTVQEDGVWFGTREGVYSGTCKRCSFYCTVFNMAPRFCPNCGAALEGVEVQYFPEGLGIVI